MAFTTSELEKYLRRCGYGSERLRRDYAYSDRGQTRSVALAGFAYQTCDARDACVAAHDLPGDGDVDSQMLVSTYQGLGAPVFFVCRNKTLEWWSQRITGPVCEATIEADKVRQFFDEYQERLSPQSIYRAKTIGRIDPDRQLSFVDIGLMPVLEERMGQELARLVGRMLDALRQGLGKQTFDETTARWLFQAAFWLLAAKVLRDKKVPSFRRVDLGDARSVLASVANHYGAEEQLRYENDRQKRALEAAANVVGTFSSLENLTVESLAYVYENTLIDRPTRTALGIHATPSYLVDYIVWQLFDWIREIPEEKRYVLEPTCGHGPFLVSAARLLREMMDEQDPKRRHNYLKRHLVGVETDAFAREVARLSLTLADIPNPNGWHLRSGDVYEGEALSEVAARATILLCNPPFQNFTAEEKSRYADVKFTNKAAELLARTLPHMPQDSVVGAIVPRGFLHSANAVPLRTVLVEEYELREIVTLPDKVFLSADHECAVILGRKRGRKTTAGRTKFVWVREKTLSSFKQAYAAPAETVAQSFFREHNYSLVVPELRSVWEYCESLPKLSGVARVGQGLVYKGRDLPAGAETVSKRRFKGAVLGFATFDSDVRLTKTPVPRYLNLDPSVIRRPLHGTEIGTPQVLMNYAPVSRGPWRIKALIDRKGHPITSSFLVARPRATGPSLEILWAVLNSPICNAYAYCHSSKRAILAGTMRDFRLPSYPLEGVSKLEGLVRDCFDVYSPDNSILRRDITAQCTKERLLAVDAEVMRLYDLPPRLEKQVLDLFAGSERLGVDFNFDRYFPEGFSAYIPLHEYLSEDFQRSTVDFVKQWANETRSPALIEALEAARESFEEERDADLSS